MRGTEYRYIGREPTWTSTAENQIFFGLPGGKGPWKKESDRDWGRLLTFFILSLMTLRRESR